MYFHRNVIKPFESFFIQTNNECFLFDQLNRGQDTLVLDNDLVNKTKMVNNDLEAKFIRFSLTRNNKTDFTDIRFNEESTIFFDCNKDLLKLGTLNKSMHQIYSYVNDIPLCINSLPASLKTDNVDIIVSSKEEGYYELSISDLQGDFDKIELTDNNKTIDLINNNYSIYLLNNEIRKLNVKYVFVSTNANEVIDEPIEICMLEDGLILKSKFKTGISIYNMQGRLVLNKSIYPDVENIIELSKACCYFLECNIGKRKYSHKICL